MTRRIALRHHMTASRARARTSVAVDVALSGVDVSVDAVVEERQEHSHAGCEKRLKIMQSLMDSQCKIANCLIRRRQILAHRSHLLWFLQVSFRNNSSSHIKLQASIR